MNLTLDFTSINAMGMGGGSAPPEGAHKATITTGTVEASKSGTGQNMVISYGVTEGSGMGTGCKAWFPLPNGTDAKKDAFKLSKIKRLLLAVGIPSSALGGQVNIAVTDLINKSLVIYVEDDAERSAADGRRRYEAHPVLVEDAQSALAGQWTPRGGRTTATAATAATPFNPMQAPAVPQNGGGNILSASGFGSTPMP